MTDLLVGLAFTTGAFFILLLLYFVYYFQDRRNGLKAKLYRGAIIVNAVLIISEFISSYLLYDKLSPTLGIILLKFHWYTGVAYFYFFYFYVDAHLKNVDNLSMKEFLWTRKEGKIISIITIVFTLGYIFIPFGELDYHALSYLPGFPAYSVFAYAVVIVMTTFFKYLKKKNKTKAEIAFVILFVSIPTLDLILQLIWLNIAFSPTLCAFLLLGCYFLLENPDLYVANELQEAKNIIEYTSKHKNTIISEKAGDLINGLYNNIMSSYNIINNEDKEVSKQTLNRNILDISNMVEDMQNILNISIIDEDITKIEEVEYQTSTLLTKLYDYSVKSIGNKNVKVVYDIDQFLPISLYGDVDMIYQLLRTCMNNSIQNTNVGKIQVKITCNFSNDRVGLNIEISDTGMGLKEEEIASIDKILEDEENDISKAYNYYIIKKYVAYLNGKYSLNSSFGIGTTVSLFFTQKIANQSNTGEFKLQELKYDYNLENKKILVVDNNPNDLINILNKYNAKCEVVSSFDECINKIKLDETITTIFINTDIDPSNTTIVSTIKPIMVDNNHKIIAVSTNAVSGNRKKYINEGYDLYITKPLNEYDFNEIMRNI